MENARRSRRGLIIHEQPGPDLRFLVSARDGVCTLIHLPSKSSRFRLPHGCVESPSISVIVPQLHVVHLRRVSSRVASKSQQPKNVYARRRNLDHTRFCRRTNAIASVIFGAHGANDRDRGSPRLRLPKVRDGVSQPPDPRGWMAEGGGREGEGERNARVYHRRTSRTRIEARNVRRSPPRQKLLASEKGREVSL